jgi:hypothetical protein
MDANYYFYSNSRKNSRFYFRMRRSFEFFSSFFDGNHVMVANVCDNGESEEHEWGL